METNERVPLVDTRLELTQHLTPDERAELAGSSLPVVTAGPGPLPLRALLARHHAFGATVLDGVVLNLLRVGEQTGIQLLGPGDLLVPGSEMRPSWLGDIEFRTTVPVRLGLFGNELLAAVFRWPRVVQGLHGCMADQLHRLTAQMVICQLPRVDERVLAMLWLLSESWGQVTPGGTRLPMPLTHETIGALVGARRPTVTLALRKLVSEDAIVHQDSGWLLLQPPPQPTTDLPHILPPEVSEVSASRWSAAAAPSPDPGLTYAELRETVRRLREQHGFDRQQTSEQLKRIRKTRVRLTAARKRISADAFRRRSPPSS